MSAPLRRVTAASDGEYEDLLSQWADLESALSLVLSRPLQVQDFAGKVHQLDHWLQDLVAHDIDAALYLMFQLASISTVGYSASHALVCATLCHIAAKELGLPQRERDSLVRAALTMNIGMTAMQNELALQREGLTPVQQQTVKNHPLESQALLNRLFITDVPWLTVVGQHHTSVTNRVPLADQAPQDRLTRILSTIDRYAAMISPRQTRVGRSTTESARSIFGQDVEHRDEVSYALVRSIGLCPPGTFVKLDNGETAVVLRRSDKANHPLVASLLDRSGGHHPQPGLHRTASGKPHIQSALARSAVSLELNHRTMVRLGLFAAKHSVGQSAEGV